MKTLKILYKKNTQGKIEQWKISVEKVVGSKQTHQIETTFGELGGKQQKKYYLVTEGKNIGKKNQTSAFEQAIAEAFSKWEKKKKQGYVDNLKDAEAGKLDSIIEGGIVPMLAHSYDDYQDKVQFPCYVQPKLDGQRCLAIRDKKGNVTLWTRTRKAITSCPHIIEDLQKILNFLGPIECALDGELFCDSMLQKAHVDINGILIDKEDLPKLNGYNPFIMKNGYAAVTNKQRKHIYVHRIVMGEPEENIDHINGNKLDCRKKNLRICSMSENIANTKKRITNKSGFKGVSWFKPKQKWCAEITKDYRRIHIGYFETPEDAAKAYDEKAKELFDDFAQLNFPKDEFSFEMLMSAVRKKEPSEASKRVQYHVYDVAVHPNGAIGFEGRKTFLDSLPDYFESVQFVHTTLLHNKKELELAHAHMVDAGYEGMMVRTRDALYENKRSKHLLKFKSFQDAEFLILDCIPGKDNSVVFVCRKGFCTFEATMSGDKKNNQKYLKNPSLWKGKKLTVKFQGYTGAKNVPRFPVGLRIRGEE